MMKYALRLAVLALGASMAAAMAAAPAFADRQRFSMRIDPIPPLNIPPPVYGAPEPAAPPPAPVQASITLPADFGTGGVGYAIASGYASSRVYVVNNISARAQASASAFAYAFASASAISGGGGKSHGGGSGCGGCR
jgi:hypothetical protein